MADEASETRSTIAKGTTFTGRVKSESPVVVNGTIDGEVEAPSLEIADGGVVSGRIKVDRLKSSGELAGQVEAGQVELGGKVRDDTAIRARQIEVKLTSDGDAPIGLTIGNARLEVGDMPKSGEGSGGGKGNGGKKSSS